MRQYVKKTRRNNGFANLLASVAPSGPTPPTVISITPDNGSTAGGTAVSIEVNDSTGATGASVGGVPLTSFTIIDGTHVGGDTGAHAAGAVDVIVTNGGGDSAPLVGAYTYVVPVAPPVITGINYSVGDIDGDGQTIVLDGTDFDSVTVVTVDGVGVSFVYSLGTISFTLPAHASTYPGTIDIEVTNPSGSDTVPFMYFSPADLIDPGTLYDGAYFDARKGVTLTGSDVDQWDDQGSNAYPFNTLTGVKPVFVPNAFGTEPGIQYTAPNSELTSTTGVLNYAAQVEIFIGQKWTSTDAVATQAGVNAPMTTVGDYQGNSALNIGASDGSLCSGIYDGVGWLSPRFGYGLNDDTPYCLSGKKIDAGSNGNQLDAFCNAQNIGSALTGNSFTGTAISDIGVGFLTEDGADCVVAFVIWLTDLTVTQGDRELIAEWAAQSFGTGLTSPVYDPVTALSPTRFYAPYLYNSSTQIWYDPTTAQNAAPTGTPPASVNLCPEFAAGVSGDLGNPTALSLWAGVGNHTLFAAADVTAINSNNATPYANECLIGDSDSYIGLFLKNPSVGVYQAIYYEYDGATRVATFDISAFVPAGVGRISVIGRKVGGNLEISVNGGAWVTGNPCGNTGSGTGTLRIGGIGAITVCNAQEYAAGTWNRALSDAEATALHTWAAAVPHSVS